MNTTWKPTATFALLRRRAEILVAIREFFFSRKVLEVHTPLLSHSTVTDPYVESFCTQYYPSDNQSQSLYLQTSPEFAMKRLLAAGSGPIYQITHAFRNQGEQGRWHNPEFTILEWYRPGFSLAKLMDETEALLKLILTCPSIQRISYAELFQQYVHVDPHQASVAELKKTLDELEIYVQSTDCLNDRDIILQLLLEHVIQYQLNNTYPLFLYDFPASQAALARIKKDPVAIAERFEVYYKGVELANGFHELADPVEQKSRFDKDLIIRKQNNLCTVPIDQNLLAALMHGLPDCSGIAMGIDRLVALATSVNHLHAVIPFPIQSA